MIQVLILGKFQSIICQLEVSWLISAELKFDSLLRTLLPLDCVIVLVVR